MKNRTAPAPRQGPGRPHGAWPYSIGLAVLALVLLISADVRAESAARSSGPVPALEPQTVLTRIGFGSCLHQRKPQPIWRAIIAAKPQLFLMMGDNVYGDVKSAAMSELQAAYQVQAQNPDFRAARGALRLWAVWDDHDYGRNDAGGDFPYRGEAARLFREFWGETGLRGSPDHPGLYAAKTFGPKGRRVQIILLDTRSFRSPLTRGQIDRVCGLGPYHPDPDPAKTMLGEAQWAWLEARLKEPAELRLIVSGIQVLADGHGWERWGELPLERARLLRVLAKSAAKGVIFLSGDRHLGAIYREGRALSYSLYEVTSSALNMPIGDRKSDEPATLRVGAIYTWENFGLITIDWEALQVELGLRDRDGKAVRRLIVPMAQLGG